MHEIKHDRQSYSNGGIKFNNAGYVKTSAKSFSEGRANEVEVYRVGYSYDTDSFPIPVKSVNEINDINLMKILDDNGTPIYKALNVKDK